MKSWWKTFNRSDKVKQDDKGKVPLSSGDTNSERLPLQPGAFQEEGFGFPEDGIGSEEREGGIEESDAFSFTEDDDVAPLDRPKRRLGKLFWKDKQTPKWCNCKRTLFNRAHSTDCIARLYNTRTNSANYIPSDQATDIGPHGIFGVPLHASIRYANVAISLFDDQGESYIYGYVPIVVAKCGVYLKEKGKCSQEEKRLVCASANAPSSHGRRRHLPPQRKREAYQGAEGGI